MDLKRKLTSRKFWALLASFVTSVLIAFNFTEATIVQITAIISAFGAMVTYILAEASIDRASVKNNNNSTEIENGKE